MLLKQIDLDLGFRQAKLVSGEIMIDARLIANFKSITTHNKHLDRL